MRGQQRDGEVRAPATVFPRAGVRSGVREARLGVGTFIITVGPTELISNPLCYGEMLTTPLFHEKLLDACSKSSDSLAIWRTSFTHCRILPIPIVLSVSREQHANGNIIRPLFASRYSYSPFCYASSASFLPFSTASSIVPTM